jgi:hypothetical protein
MFDAIRNGHVSLCSGKPGCMHAARGYPYVSGPPEQHRHTESVNLEKKWLALSLHHAPCPILAYNSLQCKEIEIWEQCLGVTVLLPCPRMHHVHELLVECGVIGQAVENYFLHAPAPGILSAPQVLSVELVHSNDSYMSTRSVIAPEVGAEVKVRPFSE